MFAVHKYPLQFEEEQGLSLPGFSPEILSIQVQDDRPVLYARVEPGSHTYIRYTIYSYGTGRSMPQNEERRYIGTAMLLDGKLVLHYFV